jgi:hypothetical protein
VRIEVTRHAAERLAERGIPLSWVEDALRAPDWTEPDPGDPTLRRAYRRIAAMEHRVLRVVFFQAEPDLCRLITAFFDRDAEPTGSR